MLEEKGQISNLHFTQHSSLITSGYLIANASSKMLLFASILFYHFFFTLPHALSALSMALIQTRGPKSRQYPNKCSNPKVPEAVVAFLCYTRPFFDN
jgi:hypothetical protein